MLFPDGLAYDLENHSYRTERVNELFRLMAHAAKVSEETKKRNPSKKLTNSAQVTPAELSA